MASKFEKFFGHIDENYVFNSKYARDSLFVMSDN